MRLAFVGPMLALRMRDGNRHKRKKLGQARAERGPDLNMNRNGENMQRITLVRRYLVFLVGLLVTAMGMAFTTKGNLGNSPLGAIPQTLSVLLPALTIGNWTILLNLLLVLLQVALLGRSALKPDLVLQIVTAVAFGYLIDLSLLCIRFITPASYLSQLLLSLAGCLLIGFGVYLEVAADVVMLPGDAFNRALAQVSGKSFGAMRMLTDITMTVISAALSLLFLRRLTGVREGTVIAALTVGNLVKLFGKLLNKVKMRLLRET